MVDNFVMDRIIERNQTTLMLKAEFSSDPRNVAEVEKMVEAISNQYRLNDETRANLLISLTEAVNNAIIHGNNSQPSKRVIVQMRECADGLAVRVKDEGRGFDLSEIPDPTKPENICECGGRGVFLMNQLCDKMSYSNGGSTVEMQFHL